MSTKRERRRLKLQLAGVALAGVVIHELGAASWGSLSWAWSWFAWFANVVRCIMPPLGDALIIAPILAVVIELDATERLLRAFAEDISHIIIGRLLPDALREHLLKYLSVEFVRTHWSVEYRIDAPDPANKPGWVRLRTLSAWTVQNVSRSAAEYDFRFEIPEGDLKLGRITALSLLVDGRRTTIPPAEAKLEKDRWYFSKLITMPPSPHSEYKFVVEAEEWFPLPGEAAIIAQGPVLRTAVTVLCDMPDLEIDDLWLTFAEAPTTHRSGGRVEWNIEKPMLEGQGFFVSWRKMAPPAAEVVKAAE